MGPSPPHSTVLTLAEEAMVIEFRRRVWIDMAAQLDEAIHSVQRVSAERDVPITRIGDDEQLTAAGY